MVKSLKYIVLAIIAIIVMACGGSGHTVEMHNNEQNSWSEYVDFYYDNTDSLCKRDISIVVRYGKSYVADSVAMSILCVSPDSMVCEEPFTIHIPHLADMRPEVQTFPYRHNVVLRNKGRYLFRLHPDTITMGISSIGLSISEVDK